MKKALVLVNNELFNDKRVQNIAQSLVNIGYKVTVLAVQSHKNSPKLMITSYQIKLIALFSAFYSKKIKADEISQKTIEKKNVFYELIKHSELRLYITSFLNSAFYTIQVFIFGLLNKYDYIWSNDLDTLTIGYILSKIRKAKIHYDSHEVWLQGVRYEGSSLLKKAYWRFLEKHLIKRVNSVSATTDMRARFLEKKYGVAQIFTLRNCPLYTEITVNKNLFREEFKIPADKKIVLYQGAITERRGIFNIIKALKNIDNIVMIFMGDGSDKVKLKKYCLENNLSKKVFVKDAVPVNILLNYTASADVGLQLLINTDFNHYSTISNKIFEYVMAEIPIIASDFPEIRKIVVDNNFGFVVNPDNLSEIAKQVEFLVNNENFYSECKRNLKNKKAFYTWEQEETKIKSMIGDNSKSQ